MLKLAWIAAAVAALGAIGAQTPAQAAVGQCYDAYGRPVGPPHNTDNPPYGLICQVYRQGGSCTFVDPQWAAGNCGINFYDPQYRYRYDPGYRQRQYQDRYRRYTPPPRDSGRPRLNPETEEYMRQRRLYTPRPNPDQR
jgi:hypothetical protein